MTDQTEWFHVHGLFFISVVITASQATTTRESEAIDQKKYEEYCKQSVAIANAVFLLATIPIHMVSMFILFTKIEKLFNPTRLASNARREQFKQRLFSH